MWAVDDPVQLDEGIARFGGFYATHIQGRAREGPIFQCREQGRLIDEIAPRRVDQTRGRFHLCQIACIDHPPRFSGRRAMERYEIGGAEQRVQIGGFNAMGTRLLGRQKPRMGDHAKPKCSGARNHLTRNLPKADQAEHLSGQPPQGQRRLNIPCAAANQPIEVRDLVRKPQEQRHRLLGHIDKTIIRHVGNGNALRGCIRHVDVV